jgi:hypothetical protein
MLSASAVNAPRVETTRLSCTLSILAAQGVATKGSHSLGMVRRGGSFQSPISDVLLPAAAYSPRQVLWMKQASTPSKIGCTREAQGWGGRRDSGAGTRRLEVDTANGGLVVDGGGAFSLTTGGGGGIR